MTQHRINLNKSANLIIYATLLSNFEAGLKLFFNLDMPTMNISNLEMKAMISVWTLVAIMAMLEIR